MDRRERAGAQQSALLAALQGWQTGVWTSMPAFVAAKDGQSSFDPAKRTITLQPTLRAQVQNPDYTFEWVELPLLVDCPVFFPSGGGITLTFPLRVGDEVLVVFASRCIDAWWQNGGIQNQAELRMHDLSDGFCFAGVSSVPNVIPDISTTTAQLRDDAGTTLLEIDPGGTFIRVATPGNIIAEAGGNMDATVAGNVTVTAGGDASITAAGTLTLGAGGQVRINGELIINGDPYLDHQHTKVTAGFATSGPVA